MRTHYDNLKVSKDAPIEVIQAAYRSLAKKYHPDINKNNPDAARIMQIINISYEVLSDPVERKKHDAWIIKEIWREKYEASLKHHTQNSKNINTVSIKSKTSMIKNVPDYISSLFLLLRLGVGVCIIGFVLYNVVVSVFESKNESKQSLAPSKTSVSTNSEKRCDSSVQNRKWPTAPTISRVKDRRDGLSSLTLDNTRNNEGLLARLVLDYDKNHSNFLREVFIPAGTQIALKKIPAGTYRVKTQNIKNGCVQISEPINLIERKTPDGIEYSDNYLTFYPVTNGNTHFTTLPASQF